MELVLATEAQIALDHLGIIDQLGARALKSHLAGFQDVAIVGYLQRRAGILFDQEDGHAGALEIGDDPEYLAHHQRRQTQAGLIEQQQLRLGHQGPTERQHLPFSPREGAGRLRAPFP